MHFVYPGAAICTNIKPIVKSCKSDWLIISHMTENKKPYLLRHYIRIFSLYHCIFKYYDIDVLVCIIEKNKDG